MCDAKEQMSCRKILAMVAIHVRIYNANRETTQSLWESPVCQILVTLIKKNKLTSLEYYMYTLTFTTHYYQCIFTVL